MQLRGVLSEGEGAAKLTPAEPSPTMSCAEHHNIAKDDIGVDDDDLADLVEPPPKATKRAPVISVEDGVMTPTKTPRTGEASSSSAQPTNSDLMQHMQRMFAKQEAATDQVYKTQQHNIDAHDDQINRLAHSVQELNEKSGTMELTGCAPADEVATRRLDEMAKNEESMRRRLDQFEKDMKAATTSSRPTATSSV